MVCSAHFLTEIAAEISEPLACSTALHNESVAMLISGIVGCGEGMGPLCSLVKTDLNCAFKASAF